MRRPELSIKQILSWADAFHERTGQWPGMKSGRVAETPDEKWANVDQALRKGLRGLHRGQSLARLLAKHRGKRNRKQLPKYTIHRILAWADAHHAQLGRWPISSDGPVAAAPGETWYAVDMALRHGQRGMQGGHSLAQLLAARRGIRNPAARPPLTVRQILAWADRHHRTTGNWPTADSGPIAGSDGDTWYAVDKALKNASRGLARSSLAKLLARHRQVPRHVRKPPLTIEQVLAWSDEHHARTGIWPKATSGPIARVRGETWLRVNEALLRGKRTLTGGVTLAKLLAEWRGVRSRISLPQLSEELILHWARAYRRRHGRWPTRDSGPIPRSGGETWSGINWALVKGRRGLQGHVSLAQLTHDQH